MGALGRSAVRWVRRVLVWGTGGGCAGVFHVEREQLLGGLGNGEPSRQLRDS